MKAVGAKGVIHLVTVTSDDHLGWSERCLDIELRCDRGNNRLFLRETGTEGWDLVSNLNSPELLPLVDVILGATVPRGQAPVIHA
jgi:hypothetical protein